MPERDPYRAEALQFTAASTDAAFGELLERILEKEPSLKAAILVGAINALTRFTNRHCLSAEDAPNNPMTIMRIWSPLVNEAIIRHRR